MIVVIGSPVVTPTEGPDRAGGLGPGIARAAARAGAAVQLVGKVGDDADGDSTLIALAQAGIGHVAVLRDPAHATPALGAAASGGGAGADDGADADGRPADEEPLVAELLLADEPPAAGEPALLVLDAGDLELALRYLVDFRVVVVTQPLDEDAARVVADAAAFALAEAVVVLAPGTTVAAPLATATVLEGPDRDDGPFAELVGAFAAALDRGDPGSGAFRAAADAIGWEPVEA
jgi:hypothetical protein